MKKVKLVLFLPAKLVKEHGEDDVLPTAALAALVKEKFSARATLVEAGLSDLTIEVDAAENPKIVDELRDALCALYPGEEEAKKLLSVVLESKEDAPEAPAPTSADAPATPAEPAARSAAPFDTSSLNDALRARSGERGAASAAPAEAPAAPAAKPATDAPAAPSTDAEAEDERVRLEKCLEEIRATVGGAEFKALCEELALVAPEVRRDDTISPFFRRVYLFSINDGCGHSTYLSQLASLLSNLGLGRVAPNPIEKPLPAPDGESMDPFSKIMDTVADEAKKRSVRIISIDIRRWINRVGSQPFRSFLEFLSDFSEGNLVLVFRVPFVDKEVLDNLTAALNDRFCVRALSFPPFTREQLQAYAKRELEKYGFSLTAAAWDSFHARIIEEKSDGRFWGIDTVQKVVWEIIYNKQLSNARRGVQEKSISKKDLADLCHSESDGRLSGAQMLDALVGAESIKERINEIISQILLSRRTEGIEPPCIHMRFLGNPGTGKTTVARIIGKMLKEAGVLRVGNFYEVSGRDLCGRYIGETAPKTASICRDAYGSVLFIDEAYSLYRSDDNGRDYGREALDTLIAEMENHRDDMVVIMAGYTPEMELLMKGNPGIASRMPYVIDFPNFTREQLAEIFECMLQKKIKYDDTLLPAVREYFLGLPEDFITAKEFANARFVRNLFERTVAKAAMRAQLSGLATLTLTRDDFTRASADKEFASMNAKKKVKIGFAD